jgi:hypothetical protein
VSNFKGSLQRDGHVPRTINIITLATLDHHIHPVYTGQRDLQRTYRSAGSHTWWSSFTKGWESTKRASTAHGSMDTFNKKIRTCDVDAYYCKHPDHLGLRGLSQSAWPARGNLQAWWKLLYIVGVAQTCQLNSWCFVHLAIIHGPAALYAFTVLISNHYARSKRAVQTASSKLNDLMATSSKEEGRHRWLI